MDLGVRIGRAASQLQRLAGVVRNISKKAYFPQTDDKSLKFIDYESNRIFGSSWNSKGNDLGVRNKKAAIFHRKTNGNTSNNNHTKFSGQESATPADVSVAQPNQAPVSEQVSAPELRRPSLARELDPILTFPLVKVTAQDMQDSMELVPRFSALTDIPILQSEEVTRLDKKSARPSVSYVLEKSRPPEEQAVLDRWKENMIRELGEAGFAQWQKETFARGHNLHECIQKQLMTGDGSEGVAEQNVPFWESIQNVFPSVSEVQHVEKYVRHPSLRYHGYFDCVAQYRDKQCLIEWKTSKKRKSTLDSTFDYPLQVAAYMGAVNFDQNYGLNIDGGLVVVAYENGAPADVHTLTREQCMHYWGSWLHRLYTYWKLTLADQEQTRTAAVA